MSKIIITITLLTLTFFLTSLCIYGEISDTEKAKEHYKKGIQYLISEVYPEAISELQKAVKLDSINSKYPAALGDAYFKLEMWSKAIEEYTASSRLDPNWFWPYFRIGLCYQKMGDNSSALMHFKRAESLGSNDAKKYIDDITSGKTTTAGKTKTASVTTEDYMKSISEVEMTKSTSTTKEKEPVAAGDYMKAASRTETKKTEARTDKKEAITTDEYLKVLEEMDKSEQPKTAAKADKISSEQGADEKKIESKDIASEAADEYAKILGESSDKEKTEEKRPATDEAEDIYAKALDEQGKSAETQSITGEIKPSKEAVDKTEGVTVEDDLKNLSVDEIITKTSDRVVVSGINQMIDSPSSPEIMNLLEGKWKGSYKYKDTTKHIEMIISKDANSNYTIKYFDENGIEILKLDKIEGKYKLLKGIIIDISYGKSVIKPDIMTAGFDITYNDTMNVTYIVDMKKVTE